ncbi:SPASM domain-containing protein [Streptomyces sp. O3]
MSSRSFPSSAGRHRRRATGAARPGSGTGLNVSWRETGRWDRKRAFGRGSRGAAPTIADLCGHCAHEKCAIGPNGDVWPCVLGRFLTIGSVRETPIAEIWSVNVPSPHRRVRREPASW